jgi:hypothetical protein
MRDVEIKNIDESNFEDIPNQQLFDCQSCICFEYPKISEKISGNIAREKKREWFKKIREMQGSVARFYISAVNPLASANTLLLIYFLCRRLSVKDVLRQVMMPSTSHVSAF